MIQRLEKDTNNKIQVKDKRPPEEFTKEDDILSHFDFLLSYMAESFLNKDEDELAVDLLDSNEFTREVATEIFKYQENGLPEEKLKYQFQIEISSNKEVKIFSKNSDYALADAISFLAEKESLTKRLALHFFKERESRNDSNS